MRLEKVLLFSLEFGITLDNKNYIVIFFIRVKIDDLSKIVKIFSSIKQRFFIIYRPKFDTKALKILFDLKI